jgi:superoxide dismutase
MKKFSDKINWKAVSEHLKLSEDFIRKFKDNVDWEAISQYQNTL